ncbi:MAG: hypothetical protein EOM49_01440 [Epsilonproteobacteria bacterium]|uniref:Uncharacterized protein n=1 Tax=Sulfurospirillum cavolei TaxID=366522 RepID=A0A2D3W375_9BACT|nr:hypothetical protein [Campylobacterota bacterium]DAB35842.1 MAG TPA: hypothetical protein CFH80_08045 [Sulfurospirillum cavolei]
MHTYITNTEFGVEALIKLIFEEKERLETLTNDYISKQTRFTCYHQEFQHRDFNEDYCDLQVQDSFHRMAKAKQEAELLKNQIDKLHESIQDKDFSIRALCGALLQIAKQGISYVYHNLSSAPNGRIIKGDSLKNIIWQGRNQSLHYEQGNFKLQVTTCFNILAIHDTNFSLTNPPQNKSLEIIKLLQWTSYENYKNDMISILG